MDLFTLILHNLFSFIVIISIIVFIHEYGHYWVARRCGVKIDAFSIGFGPEIWGWNDTHGTRWKISAVPLGGYVKMFGDEGAASTPDHEKLKKLTKKQEREAFHSQPLLNKSLIVAAGPAANFILAIIILMVFFNHYGRPETVPEVAMVMPGSAAEETGLLPGDVIVGLRGEPIHRFQDIQNIVALYPNQTISLIYQRGGNEVKTNITPKQQVTTDVFGNEVEVGIIGITSNTTNYRMLSVGESLTASVEETYSLSKRTLEVIWQMITGSRSTDQLSGILRIADYSGQSVDQGLKTVFWFMAILSINLGLINLLPIPMLDGGHLTFYLIEAVIRKPLSPAAQDWFFRAGFVFLIMIMLLATFNDLKHFGLF